MRKSRFWSYSFVILVGTLVAIPAYGEVTTLTTDSNSYTLKDTVKFQGRVEKGDSGLVTIVIKDPNDNLVLLVQTIPDSNYNFEKSIKISDLGKIGTYNAIGFITNMTEGHIAEFDIQKEIESTESSMRAIDESEPIVHVTEKKGNNQQPLIKPSFVDPQRDPKYYVDRYYNEQTYRSWFDMNYPEYTIEEAVGYTSVSNEHTLSSKNEFIQEAEATSITGDSEDFDNGETAQIILALSALGILFGATYGIKRKIDNNSKQISLNKETIKKIIQPIIGHNPLEIINARLAKGEITIEEYDILKRKLG